MREEFLKMLENLDKNLILMSNLVENAITFSVEALISKETENCKRVYDLEKQINEKEKYIENLCTEIIIRQQPVAKDFRRVNAAQKMIIDLERIGDNAEDIAHLAERLSLKKNLKEFVSIPKMATETINIVKLSLRSYINDDTSEINNMETKDDIIDDLFDTVREEISEIVLKSPESIDTALDILMVAKYLEKIADRAVNIAEHVKQL